MKKSKKINLIDFSLELLLALSVILFILMPFLSVFIESFIIDGSLNFKYYKDILANKNLLYNSLKLGVLTSLLSLITSVIVSVYTYLSDKKIQKIINVILAITLISPPFVTSLSYINLFGRRGFITYNILHLSFNPYNMWGVSFMQTLSFLSLNCLVLLGLLNNMSKDILNSARSLGADTNSIIII